MISVIVPIYNAAQYLQNCIEVILQQSVKDMEVILIDDGSTDKSGAYCDKYATVDVRIKVTHTANGGAAHARNVGLDQARGEFIVFMDADDSIPTNHLQVLLETQKKYDADLVVGAVTYVPGPKIVHKECVYTAWEFIEKVLYRDGVGDYPIGKLYRRELFEKIRFKEGITSEDFEVFYRLYQGATRVAITDKTTYFYRQNSSSVSNGGFSEKFFNRIEICEHLLNRVQIDCPEILAAAQSRAADEAIWLYGLLPRGYSEQECWIKRTVERYKDGILEDPKATVKVKRKIRIFCFSPGLWKLRMKAKALLITGSVHIKNLL